MKTAMQELLDELNIIQIVEKDKLFMVEHIIHKCLEKEKEQLEEARLKGYGEGYNEGIYDAENK
jgi:hypothetical protein